MKQRVKFNSDTDPKNDQIISDIEKKAASDVMHTIERNADLIKETIPFGKDWVTGQLAVSVTGGAAGLLCAATIFRVMVRGLEGEKIEPIDLATTIGYMICYMHTLCKTSVKGDDLKQLSDKVRDALLEALPDEALAPNSVGIKTH